MKQNDKDSKPIKLEFIDGKFLLDGKVVPPKFGDKEQVELLNNLNNIKSAVKCKEYNLPNWEGIVDEQFFTIQFRCICGRAAMLHPKHIETEFVSTCEMEVSHTCECGIGWKGKSEEGFFYNFKPTKK